MKTNTIHAAATSESAAWFGNELAKLSDFESIAEARLTRGVTAVPQAALTPGDSEDSWRLLFESNPQPMWVCDLETLRFLAVNQAALAQYGYLREEFLNLTIKEVCQAEQIPPLLDSLDEARCAPADQGSRKPALWHHRRKDGTGFDVTITAHPVLWAGRRAGLVLLLDATERVRVEHSVTVFARSVERLNAATTPKQVGQVLVGAGEDLFTWDACLFYLYDGARDEACCVISMDTLNGQKTDVPLSAVSGQPSPQLRYVLQNGSQLNLRDAEDVMPVAARPFGDTTRLSASLMWVPVRLGPKPIGVLSIQSYTPRAYDAAALGSLQRLADLGGAALARIEAQQALEASEARCHLLSECQSEGLCAVDEEMRFLSANPAAERMFGTAPGALAGRTLGEFLSPEQLEFLGTQIERRLRGEPITCELSITRADGEIRVLLIAMKHQEEATGKRSRALCVFRDISQQKRAELLVAQTQLRLQTVWDAAIVPMQLADATGKIVMVNRAYCDLVGLSREKLEGHSLLTIYSPASKGQVLCAHAQRFERDNHLSQRTAEVVFWNGKCAFLEIAESFLSLPGQPPMLLSVIRDTTHQREIEAQLRQMQRLDSIGQLAAGVAHDFNNILSVIQGEAHLLLMDAGAGSPSEAPLCQIQQAADRAAKLTRQLLLFSRQHSLQLAAVNLNEVVEGLAKMLKRLLGEHIATRFIYSAVPATIIADVGMMEQVLVNLCVNARDAMPKGGHLLVETSLVKTGAEDLARMPEAQLGQHVCLRVTDTGCGILPVALPRIFEPFFTTKETGQGTGLGLATVYGIVKQHKGWITVDTEVGKGSTFRVFLPRSDRPAAFGPPPELMAFPMEGRGKTILAVEDEAFLREVNCTVLQRHGYRVLPAESGPQALELAKTGGKIDLLLTDMVMPGNMSGRDLAEALHACQPDLHVLYTSGYAAGMEDTSFLRRVGTHFLPKPYDANTLCLRVAQCLDASANGETRDSSSIL